MNDRPHDDARPTSLHKRLTVALASTAERAQLTGLLARDVDGAAGVRSPLVRSEDVWLAADAVAQGKASERTALRTRLEADAARTMHDRETAAHQLEHLTGWQQVLVDGASWSRQLQDDLSEQVAGVEAARAILDERRHEQRAAQIGLERVLEQRAAAAEAIEVADRELAELGGIGMDESELRRELEAAGQSVRDAERVHANAMAQLATAQAERTTLVRALEDLGVGSLDHGGLVTTAMRVAVADALDAYRMDQSLKVDPHAEALAQAWSDLTEDIDRLAHPLRAVPSEQELAAAHARAERAAEAARELAATSGISPEQRQAIDAAHEAVLDAEEKIGRRIGGASAQRRLDEAREAERALLDEHGFSAYIDVVMTGGRVSGNDTRRAQIERESFEATNALSALQLAAAPTADAEYLRAEQARLREAAVDLLGVDPGDNTVALLEAHLTAPRPAQDSLRATLLEVGIEPVGVSLEDAAQGFLDEHGRPDQDALDEVADEAAGRQDLEDRLVIATHTVGEAQTEVDRSDEALQLAQTSVAAFENELSVRAGEDLARMKRVAAAEQLRVQVDAVQASLVQAEEAARAALDQADEALAGAESEFDRTADCLSDLAREARKLAEELPIDQRPEGNPLDTLALLAERLDEHSLVLQPEIDKANVEVTTAGALLAEATSAAQLAAAACDGVQPEDLVDGFEVVLGEIAADALLVLDEPFAGVHQDQRGQLLDLVATAAATRQTVLLTEDPDVLGWAIELPAEDAAAMPADALIARLTRTNHDLPPAATVGAATSAPTLSFSSASPSRIDITSDDALAPSVSVVDDPAPSTPAPSTPSGGRRWAGQR